MIHQERCPFCEGELFLLLRGDPNQRGEIPEHYECLRCKVIWFNADTGLFLCKGLLSQDNPTVEVKR